MPIDSPNKRRAALSARTFPTGVGDDPGHIEPDDARHLSLRAYPMTPRDEVPDPVGERADCVANPGCFSLGNQLHQGCYELASPEGFGFTADCNFCMPTPNVHHTYPCKLQVLVSNKPALCNAFGPATAYEGLGDIADNGVRCAGTGSKEPRGFAMRFDSDDSDVEPGITKEPFRSQTQYRYVLRGVKIHVAPCMDHPSAQNYCSGTACYSTWLCKLFLWGGASGWKMRCNTPERATANDPQDFRPDQYRNVEKPFYIDADAGVRAPIFVELATTANGGCFQFTAPYCFTEACQQPQGAFPEWDCIGLFQDGSPGGGPQEPWKPQHFLSRFYIDLSDDFGEVVDQVVYPHKNAAEVPNRNLQYAAIRDNMDQIDAPGHRSNHPYDSSQISRWRSHKSWSIEEAPHVLSGTARTRVRNKGIGAGLKLTAIRSNMHLHVERLNDCGAGEPIPPDSFRVHCSITITANFEWRRGAITDTAMASMGLSFLTDDLADWRIEDPDVPGVEHPSEFWFFRGTSRERINRKVEWRGVRAQWPYSAPNYKVLPCNGGQVGSAGDDGSFRCCKTYQMIDETNIYAEWNDFTTALGNDGEPDPNHRNVQRYAGFVDFALPGLNAYGPEGLFTFENGAHCHCNR